MKLQFKVEDIGNNNELHAFPRVLTACCNQSLLWFMRSPKSWNVANSFIIMPSPDGKTAENFYFCQFCGKKHEAYELQTPEEAAKKDK